MALTEVLEIKFWQRCRIFLLSGKSFPLRKIILLCLEIIFNGITIYNPGAIPLENASRKDRGSLKCSCIISPLIAVDSAVIHANNKRLLFFSNFIY